MNNIVEDHGENRFANGQSSRDLRATLCGAELETQLIEAVDNVGDFLQPAEVRALSECQSKSRL